jgi:ribosomal protein S18 acetylase RimI-like enzyme
MPLVVRPLGLADRPELEAFLLHHADTSLFLRSNLRDGGLVDEGEAFQATWVGAFDGPLVAVAAHCWNGNLLVQAPAHTAAVACEAVARSGRALAGVNGPWAHVRAVLPALALDESRAAFVSHDDLFALDLDALVRPPLLDDPAVRCRRTSDGDLDLVARWRVEYCVELLRAPDDAVTRAKAHDDMARVHELGRTWLLERDGRSVAFSAFNAMLPDVVQIGGVYTPPALRSRGYARAVVAGSLAAAATMGVGRSILFTGRDNVAARRAYESIGYRRIGDYGLVVL